MRTLNFVYGCDVFGKKEGTCGDAFDDSIIVPTEKSSCPYCYVRYKMFPARGYGDQFFLQPKINVRHLRDFISPSEVSEIYIGSIMGDFLSPSIEDKDIAHVFDTFGDFPQHVFFLLSKNAGRYYKFLRDYYQKPLPDNVIIGTSVENDNFRHRVDLLRASLKISPNTRLWLEIEPLLGFHHKTDFSGIEYVSCSCLGQDQIYYQNGKRFPWVFREEWMQSIIDNPTLDKENLSIYHNIKNLCNSQTIRDWENPNLYERFFHKSQKEETLW